MDPKFEANQLEIFLEMFKKGYIYRGFRPVYWSPSNKTALAEAELEYPENHKSISIFVAFPMKKKNGETKFSNLHALIWTTTPWTLVANVGVCFNQDFKYNILKKDEKHYLVSQELTNSISKKMNFEIISEIDGFELNEYICQHPFYDRESILVHGDHVTNSIGTGLVHTAPGHGHDDFYIGKKHNLPILCPVDESGKYTKDAIGFEGKFVLTEGTKSVIELLIEKGYLVHQEEYLHKYPYDWRSKKPIIIRTTQQWFSKLDELRETAIKAIENVNLFPSSARNRLESMIYSRNEWCISRQRKWGVPIPVFENIHNGEILANEETIQHVIDLVRIHGTDCWFKMSIEELLHPKYNPKDYIKGKDTLDVWFDSGSSWYSALKDRGIEPPVDIYLEGSDQFRGWFQSSLLICVATKGRAPYKTIVSHGFVLDESGRKMSKSLGNIVEPSLIVEGGKDKKKDPPYGADVLRLWISSSDFTKDILIGPNVISIQFELYSKIRNTVRFMLGNINDIKEFLPLSQLRKVDQFILFKFFKYHKLITSYYENFEFYKVNQLIRDITHVDLSSFYLDIVKDRLYSDAGLSRHACQTTLYHLLLIYTKWFAPILCHMAEDIRLHLPIPMSVPSLFLSEWPELNEFEQFSHLEGQFNKIFEIKESIQKIIEKKRVDKLIKTSLEVSIEVINPKPEIEKILKEFSSTELEEIFICSEFQIKQDDSIENVEKFEEFSIRVTNAKDHKCVRCWKYKAKEEHGVCERCNFILKV